MYKLKLLGILTLPTIILFDARKQSVLKNWSFSVVLH